MGFLRVESQDLPCDFPIWNHERRNRFGSQATHGCKAMASVGGPEAPAIRSGDSDDGIEKASGLIDYVGQALVMRVGEVALKGCGLDSVDRQNGDQDSMTAKRIFIGTYDASAGFLNGSGDLGCIS